MLKILQSIILDFQESSIPSSIPRHLQIHPMPNKACICIGVRRSGKSTYLFQIIQRLLEAGVDRENILYVNFFDDRLHGLQQAGIGLITEAYYGLYPAKKNNEKVYCFFDEIQELVGWELYIDRLMRTEKCEITITGSSAQMLSKDIATQMRGRSLSWELYPFSFHEFLDHKQLSLPSSASNQAVSNKTRLLVQQAFSEYWETGGFPEVLGLDQKLRIKIHQEYYHALLYRDLIERHDIAHPKAVSDLAYRLIDNIASLYSINKLTGYLKSLGHKVSKTSVGNYLTWFEDAYFLFTVKLFDASLSRSNANPKKIYCIDHAFVSSISSNILLNSGHKLENLVFNVLRRKYRRIYYYKTKNGQEIDFIIQADNRSIQLVQVCEDMHDAATRKREISALKTAMKELELECGIIVTRHEEESIEVDSGKIKVVAAWRFCLTTYMEVAST